MFTEETVFILGAGASWHYGYPTGEELVEMVIKKTTGFVHSLKNMNGSRSDGYGYTLAEILDNELPTFQHSKNRDEMIDRCETLIHNLSATDAIVIDSFLTTQHPEIQEIGKFMIAAVILDCEHTPINRKEKNENHNWIRFILHKLTGNCQKSADLATNKVSFITFNYDVSLEGGIVKGLRAMPSVFNETDISAFFSKERFIHIYGQVHECTKAQDPIAYLPIMTRQHIINRNAMVDQKHREAAFKASQSIFTIEENDKGTCQDAMSLAKQKIAIAKNIYILGFGFDAQNCARIGLDILRENVINLNRGVFVTNFCNKNTINKMIQKTIVPRNSGGDFVHHNLIDKHQNDAKNYYEKSKKNVYDALSEDFGVLG